MVAGRNELSKLLENIILEKLEHPQNVDASYMPFGDGHSELKIVRELENYAWEDEQ